MTFDYRKSSFSGGGSDGSCVEVALNVPGVAAVRDSKDPHGPHLKFDPKTFAGFLAMIKAVSPGVRPARFTGMQQ